MVKARNEHIFQKDGFKDFKNKNEIYVRKDKNTPIITKSTEILYLIF
jgi:hypothetical protein